MQLVINPPGSYLGVKEANFLVKNEDKVFEHSTRKVQSIMITTNAYLGTYEEVSDLHSQIIGIKVNLVMKDCLKPRIGRHILEEVVSI
jgi:hypothetical protein